MLDADRMDHSDEALREIAGRWQSDVVLKRDVFSTIERGRFKTEHGEVDAVLRRIDGVPWWSWLIARHLFDRERRTLAVAGPRSFQPMNVNFGLFPPLTRMPSRDEDGKRLRGSAKTIAKKRALTARALADLDRWIAGGYAEAAE